MLRLVITAIISLLISFGAISKSHKISRLLNHVTQDHVSHSHDHHGHHHHHHKHSHKKSKKGEKEHSHHFDFSLLVQALSFESYHADTEVRPLLSVEVLPPFTNATLLLCRYSFSIFRPPIA